MTGHLPLESVDRGDAVIELRDVVKEYPGSPPVRALDGVSMRIDRGQLVAMVGPSGSGKSTMLNVMGALDRPSSGQVLVEGRDIATLGDAALSAVRGRAIGFVFQHFHLIDGQRALDNVADGLLYRGIGLAERRERAAVALDQVGLGHRGGHRPGALSGGERQRVAVARAFLHDAPFILLDEPTSNLDSLNEAVILHSLAEERANKTVVLVSHRASTMRIADTTYSVENGRMS